MKGLLLLVLALGLHLPKEQVGVPMLAGSRIIEVNRSGGKAFGAGQRNLQPVLMQFEPGPGKTLVLRPVGVSLADGRRWRGPRMPHREPASFPILEETDSSYLIDISGFFSTYPEPFSAIPPNVLRGPALEHEILSVRQTDRYLQVTGHYRYPHGLDVTAACHLIFLPRTPMPARSVDPHKAGYNGVEYRRAQGGRAQLSQRWDLRGGKTIDFYVDKAFPRAWYPYIKEGIEDWNKAFEAIGLGRVISVRPEPEDGSLNRLDPLVNMVRYMDGSDEANAKGDALYDPRSGEILQGDILWWPAVVDRLRDWRYVQTGAADPQARLQDYPMEMLGPMIRYSICHEMGHVLGLSHNMGASFAYPADSLRSVSFTQQFGTAASVMDYARFNHLATATDVAAGVGLLPPRLGPYDYYAIACGYADGEPEPGAYCRFEPNRSAAISPDPSAQPESLGDDLLRSSAAGVANCRALLGLDGLDARRTGLLRSYYYRYLFLALSNVGGVTDGIPVDGKVRKKTVKFVMDALLDVPDALSDPVQERRILDELTGNFLPQRLVETAGEKALKNHYRQLRKYRKRLPLKDVKDWKYFN